jgi:CheY-like chemotaxis protein
MPAKPTRAYCPSCGEEVEVFVMISSGDEKPHCSLCGLALDSVAEKPRPQESLDTIIIADDSVLLRQMLVEMLTGKKIAKTVIPSSNGKEFLAIVTDRFRKTLPINLAILDVQMPVLDGVNAAKTMRVLEDGFKRPKKIPILFFSVIKCDDRFKQILNYCKPAAYLNKGASSTPEQLAARVYDVILRLLR